MTTQVDIDGLVSPRKKLLRFFVKSRDNWKAKYQNTKAKLKLANNQVRAVEKSRKSWREKYEAACQQLESLQQQLDDQKQTPAC